MRTLWFVVPAHGRVELARICLRQLRRTCDALLEHGIEATAVVVACDENLDTARDLGFGTVERNNEFLSRRFNDGIQLALDGHHNPRPANYVVPCGSDDWIDHRILVDLTPNATTMVGFQHMSFVREDGQAIASTFLSNPAGSGIRIYPRALMRPLGWRPADEDRCRACDTSILYNLQRHWGPTLKIQHRHLHDRQIVDWKTPGEQVTPYETIKGRHRQTETADPFTELAGFYPQDALEDMRAVYAGRVAVAA